MRVTPPPPLRTAYRFILALRTAYRLTTKKTILSVSIYIKKLKLQLMYAHVQ